jgi:hypothetical protein
MAEISPSELKFRCEWAGRQRARGPAECVGKMQTTHARARSGRLRSPNRQAAADLHHHTQPHGRSAGLQGGAGLGRGEGSTALDSRAAVSRQTRIEALGRRENSSWGRRATARATSAAAPRRGARARAGSPASPPLPTAACAPRSPTGQDHHPQEVCSASQLGEWLPPCLQTLQRLCT